LGVGDKRPANHIGNNPGTERNQRSDNPDDSYDRRVDAKVFSNATAYADDFFVVFGKTQTLHGEFLLTSKLTIVFKNKVVKYFAKTSYRMGFSHLNQRSQR